jgi:hypothetical protein
VWIFFIFWPRKIRISLTGIISTLFPPRCCLSSGRRYHTATSCHTSFLLSKDELAASASSFGNALSCCLISLAKTEVLNLHHRRRLPSPDRPTITLHCYKKIISTLVTLPTTQPCLHFASSLASASCHRSSICHCRFLSPLSHGYCPSAQWHSRWQICRPSFAFLGM